MRGVGGGLVTLCGTLENVWSALKTEGDKRSKRETVPLGTIATSNDRPHLPVVAL
jgi:hypothetical protein